MVRLEASEDNLRSRPGLADCRRNSAGRTVLFRPASPAFVLGRAALRALLATYLGIAPAEVRFTYGPQGKPALALHRLKMTRVHCDSTSSNSGNLAAYAFTIGCEIGVDVEQHRALHDFENIAHRFFSPEETAELLELPDRGKTPGFFTAGPARKLISRRWAAACPFRWTAFG